MAIHLNKSFLNWFYMKRSYGYIYQEYRPSIYYWEFIKTYAKILIICSQIIFHNNQYSQLLLILFSLLIFFMINLKVEPYSSSDMNSCDRNFTIVLIFNILLFCVAENTNKFVAIRFIIQTVLFFINVYILFFVAKRLFLTKYPFSYLKMNCIQKIIFKICIRFPKLFKYIEFQPSDPYRVFRNWKRLILLLSQFQKIKKEKNFLTSELYKLY